MSITINHNQRDHNNYNNSNSSLFDRKQHIWIVRYGLTKYPIMEEFDSDLDPNEGMEHAKCIAQRLFQDPLEAPTVLYTSPFVRCAHTAQLIALAIPHAQQHHRTAAPNDHHHLHHHAHHHHQTTTATAIPMVRIEHGLTEWFTPDLLLLQTMRNDHHHLPRSAEELAETFGTIDLSHRSLVDPWAAMVKAAELQAQAAQATPITEQEKDSSSRSNDSPTAATAELSTATTDSIPFENEQDLLERCATTMIKLLELHTNDHSNLAIVSHAPCNQALTLCLLQQSGKDATTSSTKEEDACQSPLPFLPPWPLGGITKFSRTLPDDDNDNTATNSHPWIMDFYGDTSHLPGKYKQGVKGWSLPCFSQQQLQQ